MKYLVGITETLCRTIVVEASSGEEAERIAEDMYKASEIILGADDFNDVTIQCIKEEK